MKIAYIILAHKLPEQLVRLVKKINTDGTSFLVHINKNIDGETYKKMMEPLRAYENIHLLKRYASNWGTFGQVQAVLEGIRNALELHLDFDYVILLTGQDYPIKSNVHIQKYLEYSNQQSYLEFFPLPSEIWKAENCGMDRINYWHMQVLGRPHRFFRRFDQLHLEILQNFKMFGGSSLWCLARNCIEYIDEFIRLEDSFVRFFKHVGLPDEIFFQTILLNSPFKNQLINDNLRYIVWANGSHPAILRTQDYKQFIDSNKLFARKFDMTIDANVLDMIDRATS